MSASCEAVISVIENAFNNVQKPHHISMRGAREIDDGHPDDKHEARRQEETERHWSEISDEMIEHYDDILPFLDASGFRYYIPRYMIWTLQHYHNSDLAISEYTIGIFSGCWEQWDILNAKQKSACLEFLAFCAHETSEHLNTEQAKYAYRLLTL